MSRGGRISVVRPTRAEKCSKLVADAAREMAPACGQAAGFFFQGLADFVTAPVSESARDLSRHVSREGATQININFADLADRYDTLRAATVERAAAVGLALPSVVAQRPPIITAESIRVQEEALRRISAAQVLDGTPAVDLDDLTRRMSQDQERTQEAFNAACLVAGHHLGEPSHPVFDGVSDFIRATDASQRDTIARQIGEWAAQEGRGIQKEAEQTWVSVLLAASKLALEDAGLNSEAPNLGEHTITARDPEDSSKLLEVRVNPQTGELQYELKGYSEGRCKPVEERFLHRLSELLGAEFTPQNLHHWDTEAPRVRTPRQSTGTRTPTDGADTSRESTRDKQRG